MSDLAYNRRHTDPRPAPAGGMTNAQVLAWCRARAAAMRAGGAA